MIDFFHQYLPQPVLIDFGVIQIYYYGLIFVIAVVAGLFLLAKLSKKRNLATKHLDNLIFYLFIFGLIGARLYHVLFYNFQYFYHAPWKIFYFWEGGIAIQGAIIAGILSLVIYCKKQQINFWQYSDVLIIPLIFSQAIGRLGNYFNQEVYGRPTDLGWGIPISPENRIAGYENFTYYHPLFIYEAVLNLFLFIILLILFYKKSLKEGRLTLIYLIGYSTIRFFMEFLRIEPVMTIFGVRWPQIVSLLVIIISLRFIKK